LTDFCSNECEGVEPSVEYANGDTAHEQSEADEVNAAKEEKNFSVGSSRRRRGARQLKVVRDSQLI